jgi:hypothetical protein
LDAEDEAEYRKSVRNMSIVVALIAMTAIAGVLVAPLFYGGRGSLPRSVTVDSGDGFSLVLAVNSTQVRGSGGILVDARVLSDSRQYQNISASASWRLAPASLYLPDACSRPWWPVGVGIMAGRFGPYNFTSAAVVYPEGTSQCPPGAGLSGTPGHFLLLNMSSTAIVNVRGNLSAVVLDAGFAFGPSVAGVPSLSPGPYTVVAADEWGDVALLNFVVG